MHLSELLKFKAKIPSSHTPDECKEGELSGSRDAQPVRLPVQAWAEDRFLEMDTYK